MLKFSKANAKLAKLSEVSSIKRFLDGGRKVYSLDLLAGHSCPFANECLSKVVNGKIQDGQNTKFRCYAASLEVLFTKTFQAHKHNFDLLRKLNSTDMFKLICWSLPSNLGVCRIHSSGEFFSENYFQAWLKVARENPDKLFYAYTKSLGWWLNARDDIPDNMVLTASYGGRLDRLISENNLRFAKVVHSTAEAKELQLPIDHTDERAANPKTKDKSFSLLLHGTQPAHSQAAIALQKMRANGVANGYTRKTA